jgi:hypothetical protein
MGQRILYSLKTLFIKKKKVLKPGANEASAQELQNSI